MLFRSRPFEGLKIATIHDFSIIHYPEYHPSLRVRFIAGHLEETLRDANRIVVDSNLVRAELIDLFGLAEDKIVTVPLGVDCGFRPREGAAVEAILQRYELD